MALYVHVSGGVVTLRCVPLSAAQAGKLYQVMFKTCDPGPFVSIGGGPDGQSGPLLAGIDLPDVSHLVEYPLPDSIRTATETIQAPTDRQVVEFIARHAQDDVVIEISPAEPSARVSLN